MCKAYSNSTSCSQNMGSQGISVSISTQKPWRPGMRLLEEFWGIPFFFQGNYTTQVKMHLPIKPKLFCWAASIRLSCKIVIFKLNNLDVPGYTAGTHDQRRNKPCKKEQAQNIWKQATRMPFRKQLPPLLAFQNPPIIKHQTMWHKAQSL